MTSLFSSPKLKHEEPLVLLIKWISIAKWRKNKPRLGREASADAITADLRTNDNNLSVWEIFSIEELEDAVLAMVSERNKIDKIDVVYLPKELVEKRDLSVILTDGKTRYTKFIDRHRDIADLNYVSLERVSDCVVESVNMNRVKSFSKHEILLLLLTGMESNKIKFEALHPTLVEDIRDSKKNLLGN